MQNLREKWYAVYTKPRWEKKIAEDLASRSIHNYCPLNRVIRQWSDRKKIIYEPLFTSYVFVRVTEKQFSQVREVDGIINFVYWIGKPAVIREHEIEIIQRFLNEHKNVHIEHTAVSKRDIVRVIRGPLMESEGIIVDVKNKTVRVELSSLGCLMYAELEKSSIEVITDRCIKDLSPVW
jgi:transcription antitermination factor NusG